MSRTEELIEQKRILFGLMDVLNRLEVIVDDCRSVLEHAERLGTRSIVYRSWA